MRWCTLRPATGALLQEPVCAFASAAAGRKQRGVCAQDSYSPINSLDFHLREDLLVTAGDDDAIKLYSVSTGEHKQTNYSRKYGAAHVCFTHHERAVIYASNKARRGACGAQTRAQQRGTAALGPMRCALSGLAARTVRRHPLQPESARARPWAPGSLAAAAAVRLKRAARQSAALCVRPCAAPAPAPRPQRARPRPRARRAPTTRCATSACTTTASCATSRATRRASRRSACRRATTRSSPRRRRAPRRGACRAFLRTPAGMSPPCSTRSSAAGGVARLAGKASRPSPGHGGGCRGVARCACARTSSPR